MQKCCSFVEDALERATRLGDLCVGGDGSRLIRVLIVDGHPVARVGWRSLIAKEPDFEICGDTGCIKEAVDLVRTLRPDAVIVDPVSTDLDGLELIRRCAGDDPAPVVVVCSVRDDPVLARRALGAGARGYVSKAEPHHSSLLAVRQLLDGVPYAVHPRIIEQMIAGFMLPWSDEFHASTNPRGQCPDEADRPNLADDTRRAAH